MMIGDSYINLSVVTLAVFEDEATVTLHYAVGVSGGLKFHTVTPTEEMNRLREILARSKEFVSLKEGREYVNLMWVIRGKFDNATKTMSLSIPQHDNLEYGNDDAKTLAMKLM